MVGERSAVRPNSGKSVRQSDPGLRGPTPPPTAGRKPAARPPLRFPPSLLPAPSEKLTEAQPAQPKTGRGVGRSPTKETARSAGIHLLPIDLESRCEQIEEVQIAALIQFFRILDQWDQETDSPIANRGEQ